MTSGERPLLRGPLVVEQAGRRGDEKQENGCPRDALADERGHQLQGSQEVLRGGEVRQQGDLIGGRRSPRGRRRASPYRR